MIIPNDTSIIEQAKEIRRSIGRRDSNSEILKYVRDFIMENTRNYMQKSQNYQTQEK